ncbi:hypothetical protein Gpo141_00000651 [Globisporangium polare]
MAMTALEMTKNKKRCFAAQLVMEDRGDEHGGDQGQHRFPRVAAAHTLRQSRRHGVLSVNMEQQTVTFVYPKHGKHLFKRTFPQPLKCVAGKQVLRVYCSMGKRTFM